MRVPVRVLVVDDEEAIRESLVAYLEDDGFETISVSSGEDALKVMEKDDIDVVIIDIRLPVIDGNELLRRASHRWPAMCFLIYTGSTSYEYPKDILKLPCVSTTVYRKPLLDLRVLSEEIRRLMSTKEGTYE